ncbi:hypothetical protein [Streptomyces platensis]|uniref:hypothetical protein n=1 Tax=Streptomyces platensis TaxID=58346 RepID=UPI002E8113EF|nr:hypothetical protein [Streptomyces platensis]
MAALVPAVLTTAPALAAPSAFTMPSAESGQTVRTAATTRDGQGRGTLLSLKPLGRLSRAEVISQAQKQGLEADSARHGVAAYRLTYRTITPDGRPTTASGLLAPVGGPFDLVREELPGMFDGRIDPRSAVFYLSFFLTAQNRLHPLYDDPAEVFRAPYADRVEDLFDSEHPAEEIAGKLPERLEELLTDTWYQKLRHPSGALLEMLRANDRTCDWEPGRDVRITLYSATGDRDVAIENTRSCARQLADHGARATVVDQGADADHYRSFLRSAPSIARALPVAR